MKVLEISQLDSLVKKVTATGSVFIAPEQKEDFVFLKPVTSAEKIVLDFVSTKNSIKEFFFPACEKLMGFSKKHELELKGAEDNFPLTVIFGCKPCDAAALPILDEVFSWDYQDQFYLKRREKTVVVSLACAKRDSLCFCSSLGFSTDFLQGSDVFMYASEQKFFFKPVTDKGRAWLDQQVTTNEEIPASVLDQVKQNNPSAYFDIKKIKPWLDVNFENKDFWKAVSERCVGCGVCTYVCPTCHCFDIFDEGEMLTGCRLKTWDSCSFAQFTLHTSGHNPRHTQDERWRQRIMHKFKYYADKFQQTLCTGCGRCVRDCPVSMGVLETLTKINSI